MAANLPNSLFLNRPKLAIEFRFNRVPGISLVSNIRQNVVRTQNRQYIRQAPTRQGNVLGEILTTCDDARLGIRGKPHRLRFIELWILKCCYSKQAIQHSWRQALLLDINQICADDLCRFRQWSLNWPLPLLP